jgi:drug/metabolite transporter (DMT)-like permease
LISKFQADLGLLSVAVFWGTTFILSKLVVAEVSLPIFLFLRLTLAAVVLDFYALRFIRSLNRRTLLHGAILGFFLYLTYLFQMWGIQYTTASNAGFITGLCVVFVPVLGYLFFRFKPAINVLTGIVLAVVGLLMLTRANPLRWSKGDLLVFVCAIAGAFQVVFVGKFAPQHNVYLLTAAQLSTVSVLTVFALPFSQFNWASMTANNGLILVYLALFGTVYTFLMQTSMQRFTSTSRAALIFSMEPVFAALFAYLIAGELLGLTGWIGGLLIVAGMISAEVPWRAVWIWVKPCKECK